MTHLCRLIAHRGAAGMGPENTIITMEKALSLGVKWIECDVHLVDGVPVVIHDSTVDRTTNESGDITSFTLAELQALDAGNGAIIPTLKQVLMHFGQKASFNIELKGPGVAPAVCYLLKNLVSRGLWQWENLAITSYDAEQIRYVRSTIPKVYTGLLTKCCDFSYLQLAQELDVNGLHVGASCIDESWVILAHQLGFEVCVFTINDLKECDDLSAMGVDAVFTDVPNIMMHLEMVSI